MDSCGQLAARARFLRARCDEAHPGFLKSFTGSWGWFPHRAGCARRVAVVGRAVFCTAGAVAHDRVHRKVAPAGQRWRAGLAAPGGPGAPGLTSMSSAGVRVSGDRTGLDGQGWALRFECCARCERARIAWKESPVCPSCPSSAPPALVSKRDRESSGAGDQLELGISWSWGSVGRAAQDNPRSGRSGGPGCETGPFARWPGRAGPVWRVHIPPGMCTPGQWSATGSRCI